MLLSRVKLCQKGASFAIKALPVIVPAFLLFSWLNLLYYETVSRRRRTA